MKRNNTPPQGAPAGTVWFGGPIQEYKVTLRMTGQSGQSEWIVTSEDSEEEAEDAIFAILEKLPADAALCQVDVLCQVFLDTSNRGFAIPASLMKQLVDRKIELRIEVYDEPRGL
jgi:DNA-binding LacI/PurR family transcriptional regulator